MNMRTLAVATGFAVFCLPAAALAQSADGSPGADGARDYIGERGMTGDFWGDASRERQERQERQVANQEVKLELATRVAALVDTGQCAAAAELARSERDNRMARTVGRICEEGVGLRERYRN